MTDFDIYTNRVPSGLLTDKEQAALKAHKGAFEFYSLLDRKWLKINNQPWSETTVYRAVREPVQTVTELPMWISESNFLYYASSIGVPVTVRITRRDGEFVRGEILPRETGGEE